MGIVALLPNDCISRGIYLDSCRLPDNYMGDFTLMGFVVDQFDEARIVLASAGYQLTSRKRGVEISIDAAIQILGIQNLLTANNIGCDYLDIADTIYQA